MEDTATSAAAGAFSDLLIAGADGSWRLADGVHPMPDLLALEAEEVLAAFKRSQRDDFSAVIEQLEAPANPLNRLLAEMRASAGREPGNAFGELPLFRPQGLHTLFSDLHDHVMDHPVWRHPFFVRVFTGDFDERQLVLFAQHYFNQIKNTRQCVALALGRFSGLMPMPYGCLNERLSEMAQIVLAQLLADEYGVGTHAIEDYPDLSRLLVSTTHIAMYRRLFDGLGLPSEAQDVPMLPGVADNVLVQRLLAGHGDFTLVEALASVGLGMEWGVPEFFSLLLGGMIRWAHKNDRPLTRDHLIVFIAHVRYDVLHAISVMLVTSFFSHDGDSVRRIKEATNTLMSSRYCMMSALYRHVFGEACADIDGIGLAERYKLHDRRIADALLAARRQIAPERVVSGDEYRQSTWLPFVFSDQPGE